MRIPVLTRRFILLMALALFLFTGCQRLRLPRFGFCFGNDCEQEQVVFSDQFSVFVSPRYQQSRPRRVLIVPSGLQTGSFDAPHRFAESMAAQIRIAGVFEAVLPRNVQCNTTVDAILKGRFDEKEITKLAYAYHCDAVMLTRVNQFQGFWPLQTSATVAMVDANESVVIFAADGNWDTAVPEIKAGFNEFVYRLSTDAHFAARDIQLQSPQHLFGFVANRITNAMK